MTRKVTDNIPGYTYGTAEAAASPISMQEPKRLKLKVGFTAEDKRMLQMALWARPYMDIAQAGNSKTSNE